MAFFEHVGFLMDAEEELQDEMDRLCAKNDIEWLISSLFSEDVKIVEVTLRFLRKLYLFRAHAWGMSGLMGDVRLIPKLSSLLGSKKGNERSHALKALDAVLQNSRCFTRIALEVDVVDRLVDFMTTCTCYDFHIIQHIFDVLVRSHTRLSRDAIAKALRTSPVPKTTTDLNTLIRFVRVDIQCVTLVFTKSVGKMRTRNMARRLILWRHAVLHHPDKDTIPRAKRIRMTN